MRRAAPLKAEPRHYLGSTFTVDTRVRFIETAEQHALISDVWKVEGEPFRRSCGHQGPSSIRKHPPLASKRLDRFRSEAAW